MSKMIFQGPKHLKQWLQQSPDGQRLMDEMLAEDLAPRQRMLAVAHADRVDIYGHGPMSVTQRTQIHASGPKSEELAERVLEESLPLGMRDFLAPNQLGQKPGKLATIMTQKLTIQEYEWWKARQESIDNPPDTRICAMRRAMEIRSLFKDMRDAMNGEAIK